MLLLLLNSHVDDILGKGGEVPVAFVVLANQALERVKHNPKLVDQIKMSIIQVSVAPSTIVWLPYNRFSILVFFIFYPVFPTDVILNRVQSQRRLVACGG